MMVEESETPDLDPDRPSSDPLAARRAARAEADGPATMRRAEAAEAAVRNLETHLAALEQRLEEVGRERERIAQQLTQREREVCDTKQREYAEQQLRVEAEERGERVQREMRAQLQELHRRIDDTERNARELGSELEGVRRELSEANQTLALGERLRERSEELRERIVALEARFSEMQREVGVEREAREQAELELAALRERDARLAPIVCELMEVAAELRAGFEREVGSLRDELQRQVIWERETYVRELTTMGARMEDLRFELSRTATDLRAQLNAEPPAAAQPPQAPELAPELEREAAHRREMADALVAAVERLRTRVAEVKQAEPVESPSAAEPDIVWTAPSVQQVESPPVAASTPVYVEPPVAEPPPAEPPAAEPPAAEPPSAEPPVPAAAEPAPVVEPPAVERPPVAEPPTEPSAPVAVEPPPAIEPPAAEFSATVEPPPVESPAVLESPPAVESPAAVEPPPAVVEPPVEPAAMELQPAAQEDEQLAPEPPPVEPSEPDFVEPISVPERFAEVGFGPRQIIAAKAVTSEPVVLRPHPLYVPAERMSWLAPAIRGLAQHRDAKLAAELVIELIPAQRQIVEGPLKYEIKIDELGAFHVALDSGRATISREGAKDSEFTLEGPAAAFSELAAGGTSRRHAGLRIRKGKRRARWLLKARRRPIALADLASLHVDVWPGLLLLAMAEAIDPSWTTGRRFELAFEIQGAPGVVIYVRICDGEPILVSRTASGQPVATVSVSEHALTCLLAGVQPQIDDEPLVTGDTTSVEMFLQWTARAQGLSTTSA